MNCTSVNYKQQLGASVLTESLEGQCSLLRTDRFRNADKISKQTSFGYAIAVAHFSLQHECELDEPCPTENHLCIPDYQTGEFECICKKGFHGEFCTNKTAIGTENLAKYGAASQSYFTAGYYASNAIDQNLDTILQLWHDGCWWQVSLQRKYLLGHFVFHNRQDCCLNRANGLQIHTFNENDLANQIHCYTLPHMHSVKIYEFNCTSSRMANTVRVTTPDFINFAELEVYELWG
eukprot:TCONS_00009906-protein